MEGHLCSSPLPASDQPTGETMQIGSVDKEREAAAAPHLDAGLLRVLRQTAWLRGGLIIELNHCLWQ